MMRFFSNFTKSVFRFLVLWFVDGVSLLLTSLILPGIAFLTESRADTLIDAIAAAFLLGIVNLFIRPIILLIARPLGFIAVFVIGFFVNAVALLITSWLLPVFEVQSLLAAVLGGIIFAAINAILTGVLEVKDEGSFYQGVIERLARRNNFMDVDPDKRGLVMMEIDGLSYHHLKKALDDGIMPTLQEMMDEEGYELSRVDCGIPSQTSACQAGIMFGDNADIPAFRWYDKTQQKLFVSGNDATELNQRYANGNGLMRGGSSINNMMNGDAQKSLLTLAGMFDSDEEEKKRRAEDIYLLLLNPYFFAHTISLFFADVVREVWQGWHQRRNNVTPRLNRLAHAYPFVRAATTVFMRDIAANLTTLDIIRGAPSIYVTWPGYDEVAHHSGPWTKDAFSVLETYDRVIARIKETIELKAPRQYDLIILSDHGQSFGATFKQRYGVSLKEYIESLLPEHVSVASSMGGDTGMTSLTAVSGELDNIQESGVGGRTGRVAARQGKKFFSFRSRRRAEEEGGDAAQQAQVTAYGSGNLAQVYFDLYPRKINLTELGEVYPGMVDALVNHEGIGLVCGYEEDGTPVALSKRGKRNLHTGEVEGVDPLLPYAPQDPTAHGAASLEKRIWQVRRVMDFPNAGDLMVISTVYEDGTVAALEELIGNHGGLGGEQTDAFILHPDYVAVPDTRNATDVFYVLNELRNRPAEPVPQEEEAPVAKPSGEWTAANLWNGLKDLRTWIPLALHALVLDRGAFRKIVRDKRMTGPALLLGIVFSAVSGYVRADEGTELITIVAEVLLWPAAVFVVYWTGRRLTGKGYYTRTLRGLGFAHVGYVLDLFSFLPYVAPLAVFLGSLVSFLAAWMGAAEAHETRGLRTFLLPVLAILIVVVVPLMLAALLSGAVIGLESIIHRFGL